MFFFSSSFVHANSISLDESFLIDTIPDLEDEEEIFMIVEQGPRFPGCEDMVGSNQEKEACAQKAMLEYIYGNLKYPQIARENGIQGQVIIQYVVDKDGSIVDITLVRDIGGGCGKAALEVIQDMSNLPEKWTPGFQKGVPVKVKYTIPIVFRLEGSTKKKKRRGLFNSRN